MSVPPTCPYCGDPAVRVTGDRLYRDRPDLHNRIMWWCGPCLAWVGCHPGTDRPLGTLANRKLRFARMLAHQAFDPLWRSKIARDRCSHSEARSAGYEWLARELGIDRDKCHIAMFDEQTCKRVVEICRLPNQHRRVG